MHSCACLGRPVQAADIMSQLASNNRQGSKKDLEIMSIPTNVFKDYKKRKKLHGYSCILAIYPDSAEKISTLVMKHSI